MKFGLYRDYSSTSEGSIISVLSTFLEKKNITNNDITHFFTFLTDLPKTATEVINSTRNLFYFLYNDLLHLIILGFQITPFFTASILNLSILFI